MRYQDSSQYWERSHKTLSRPKINPIWLSATCPCPFLDRRVVSTPRFSYKRDRGNSTDESVELAVRGFENFWGHKKDQGPAIVSRMTLLL
jgi:hypothetical protein